jgi:hypothetical protein
MLTRILPERLDNDYRGHRVALVLFAFVALSRIAQSVIALVGGGAVTAGADGIPLSTYPAAAAQTIVASYTNYALLRLFLLLVCVVVLLRYRTAIAAMFLVLILHFLAAQIHHALMPVPRTGTPPAPVVNRILFGLMIIGFGLSLWEQRAGKAPANAAASG